MRLKLLPVACLMTALGLTLATAHASSLTSPPWTPQAHGLSCPNPPWTSSGNNCPSFVNNILNTTMANIASSYTGTYNSNVYQGYPDWYCGNQPCGQPPSFLPAQMFMNITGYFRSYTLYTPSNSEVKLETTFYYWLPTAITGSNECVSNLTTHWFDLEIFYAKIYNSVESTAGTSYKGCGSSTTLTWRIVLQATFANTQFNLYDWNIEAAIGQALTAYGYPTSTTHNLSAVEVGVEAYGTSLLSATWSDIGITNTLNSGGGGCSPTKLLGPPHC